MKKEEEDIRKELLPLVVGHLVRKPVVKPCHLTHKSYGRSRKRGRVWPQAREKQMRTIPYPLLLTTVFTGFRLSARFQNHFQNHLCFSVNKGSIGISFSNNAASPSSAHSSANCEQASKRSITLIWKSTVMMPRYLTNLSGIPTSRSMPPRIGSGIQEPWLLHTCPIPASQP